MKTYLVKFDTLVEGNYFYAGQEVRLLPSVAEKYIGAGLIEDPDAPAADEAQEEEVEMSAEEPTKESEAKAPATDADTPKTEETKAEG